MLKSIYGFYRYNLPGRFEKILSFLDFMVVWGFKKGVFMGMGTLEFRKKQMNLLREVSDAHIEPQPRYIISQVLFLL